MHSRGPGGVRSGGRCRSRTGVCPWRAVRLHGRSGLPSLASMAIRQIASKPRLPLGAISPRHKKAHARGGGVKCDSRALAGPCASCRRIPAQYAREARQWPGEAGTSSRDRRSAQALDSPRSSLGTCAYLRLSAPPERYAPLRGADPLSTARAPHRQRS